MQNVTDINALHAYTSAALTARKRLGLDMPTALDKAMKQLQADQARAVARIQSVPAAVDRIAAALLADGDPLHDDEFRADVAALGLGAAQIQVGKAIEAHTDREARVVLRKHLPAVVSLLAAEATRLAERIAEFREAAPGVDLLAHERPQVAAKLLTPWALAREAVEATAPIVQVWTGLHEAALGRLPSREHALIVADIGADRLDRIKQKGGNHATRAAADGIPLAVATMEEYLTRCERADQERAEEQRQRQERREQESFISLSRS